jgi:hypothetical protein
MKEDLDSFFYERSERRLGAKSKLGTNKGETMAYKSYGNTVSSAVVNCHIMAGESRYHTDTHGA